MQTFFLKFLKTEHNQTRARDFKSGVAKSQLEEVKLKLNIR
jgi:hypothetical protein